MTAYNTLTKEEEDVILNKGTEPPFSGEYDNFYQEGTFVCRQCNTPLFSSQAKFDAGCGWPAFEDTFPGAVKELADADGRRYRNSMCHLRRTSGTCFPGGTLNRQRHQTLRKFIVY